MERRDCKTCGLTVYTADPRYPIVCQVPECRSLVYPSQEEINRWKKNDPEFKSFKCSRCFRVWTVKALTGSQGTCFDCGGVLEVLPYE